ncbi:hypothetical protein C10C_0262 [Chlamydia serpentis]|uniref:Inclusion membrane protein C n=1 Tax=Chlamydia serpentis TaxID=1967782 RepID=A0A2R8FAV4_9CHLA|nr:hypothetical protein [Chlamydia serpentis]SPN73436.1 hypothetical protein C10C_0262 [Chlamydia serpentis]
MTMTSSTALLSPENCSAFPLEGLGEESSSALHAQMLDLSSRVQVLQDCVNQHRIPTTAPISATIPLTIVAGAPGGSGVHIPTSQASRTESTAVLPSEIAQLGTEVASIRTEIALIRITLQQSRRGMGMGAMVMTALLLTISLLAIAIIILAALGFTGILPPVAALLQGTTNLVWAMVSGSIVFFISIIGALAVILTSRNTTIRAT